MQFINDTAQEFIRRQPAGSPAVRVVQECAGVLIMRHHMSVEDAMEAAQIAYDDVSTGLAQAYVDISHSSASKIVIRSPGKTRIEVTIDELMALVVAGQHANRVFM